MKLKAARCRLYHFSSV